MSNCMQCGKPFAPKRRDAKFCSNVCRAQYSNNMRRTPAMLQPQLFPQNNPAPIAPQTGFSGLGNPDSYWQTRALNAEAANNLLKEQLRGYEIEKAVNDKLAEMEPETKKSGLGSVVETLGTVAQQYPELAQMGSSILGNLINGLMNKGGQDAILTGVEASKKEKLQALVEILKNVPEPIIEMILQLAAKAALNPEQFMQGVEESSNFEQQAPVSPNPEFTLPFKLQS